MVMTSFGMGDVLRDRLPSLWRRIEDAHYSYLETEDSPEKLQQKKKLEGYIIEYLSLVPHECKFGLAETGKVFQRTINELPEFSAYRAGLGWAALERYAANLLVQPWRKEYKVIRLYCGYYKHEVEANMVGAETLLYAMGYKPVGAGRVALDAPICPDMVAAISRDAIIAQCECQMMANIWEAVWGGGSRVSWAQIYRERANHAGDIAATVAGLTGNRDKYCDGTEIYSNVPTTSEPNHRSRLVDPRYNIPVQNYTQICETPEEPINPIPYIVPNMMPPMYPVNVPIQDCGIQPMMAPYGIPYYYPVQAPYMIPQVYAPAKHLPINGYSQYRYPLVPTGQLIELDPYEAKDGYKKRLESRKNSTSKSGFSDVSLPSLPRSDTQPALSKAREDGMGTYESWDYVFRNLSSKEQDDRSRFSPSLDRDSRTLDRLDREEKRSKYLPTTLDLEDGLQALNIDRSHDEDYYRTSKVNESLMRLKQEQEKRARLLKKQVDEKRIKRQTEPIGNPTSDALVSTKVAPDKVKLLSKKDIKERKDVIKQQLSSNGSNGSICNAEIRKVKKTIKPLEVERPKKPAENGHHNASSSRNSAASSTPYDLNAQLVVSLDETDSVRPTQNGHHRPSSKNSSQNDTKTWQCTTCTYLNANGTQACEMCGKSKKGPEIEPLTSGGRECPACTLVNKREARSCDACGTSLDHCPTYI